MTARRKMETALRRAQRRKSSRPGQDRIVASVETPSGVIGVCSKVYRSPEDMWAALMIANQRAEGRLRQLHERVSKQLASYAPRYTQGVPVGLDDAQEAGA